MLKGIPNWEAELRKQEFVPLIEKVLARSDGDYGVKDIFAAIEKRDMQLWSYEDGDVRALAVTQISIYPKRKYCVYVLTASKSFMGRAFWRRMDMNISAWAKHQGCDAMKIIGRKGWGGVFDMKPSQSVFKRAI